MHNIVSKLLIYGDMPKDSILMELSDIIREYKSGDYKKDEIITRIYNQIKRILKYQQIMLSIRICGTTILHIY